MIFIVTNTYLIGNFFFISFEKIAFFRLNKSHNCQTYIPAITFKKKIKSPQLSTVQTSVAASAGGGSFPFTRVFAVTLKKIVFKHSLY